MVMLLNVMVRREVPLKIKGMSKIGQSHDFSILVETVEGDRGQGVRGGGWRD